MQTSSARYLLHILIGIAAFAASPEIALCLDEIEPDEASSAGPAPEPRTTTLQPALPENASGERVTKAEQLFWEAERIFSSGDGDFGTGQRLMTEAAELDFSHAQFELGRLYIAGLNGFERNPTLGLRWFERAAKQGLGYAMIATAQCYYEGTGTTKDLNAAERWFRDSLAAGASYSRLNPPAGSDPPPVMAGVAGAILTDPEVSSKAAAHFYLGKIAQENKDDTTAHMEFAEAARQGIDGRDGILEAAKEAAYDFACGRGTPQDFEKGREMVEQIRVLTKRFVISRVQSMAQSRQIDDFATADAEEVMIKTGDLVTDLYVLGIGNTLADRKEEHYNPKEAVKWFELAAARDVLEAKIRLAQFHGGSELGDPNPEEAFKWWKEAVGDNPLRSVLATANLAICLQNGIGTQRDPTSAAALFAKIKNPSKVGPVGPINNPPAVAAFRAQIENESIVGYLGTIGKAPTKPITEDEEAALLETWARRENDAHAQNLLARKLIVGDGVKQDVDAAVALLKKAAKARNSGAYLSLGRVSENFVSFQTQKALGLLSPLEYYRKAGDLGSAEGARLAGDLLQSGIGPKRNPKLAERYYRKAIQLQPDDALAHNNLAALFEERLRASISARKPDKSGSLTAMRAGYEEAGRLGLAHANTNLGKLYLNGELVPEDYEKAYDYFTKAIESEAPEARFQLGYMHEHGKGVPVTYSEAAYHYRYAALGGNRAATDRLVDFYLTGKGVSRDLGLAEFWIRHGISLGNWRGNLELGEVLIARKNFTEAFRLYQHLANDRNPNVSGIGFYGLSECYGHGYGVQADEPMSRSYMQMAINTGNPEALVTLANSLFSKNDTKEGLKTMERAAKSSGQASYSLGQMYHFGTNVAKDHTKSFSLMRDAARMRYAKAMYFLAATTFNREAGAPAMDEAIRFAEMAESMGVPDATKLRERLERRRDKADEDQEQVARARSG